MRQKKIVVLLNIIAFLFYGAYAQKESRLRGIQFSGYYEPQYIGFYQNSLWKQLMANKFRLDLDKNISNSVSFHANFDYITYHGQNTWNLVEFIPENIVSLYVNPVNQGYFVISYKDKSFLDNIYLNMYLGNFEITIGKQQLSFGSGYVWNPTDIFNVKNIVDPTYEQPGHNAIRMDLNLGTTSSLILVFQPGSNTRHSTIYGRIKSTVGHFDLSLVSGSTKWNVTDYNYTFPVFLQYTRKLVGWDVNGEWLGMGVYTEGAYNWISGRKNFLEWVMGLDYTFESGLYFMMEYYFNDNLPAQTHQLELNDWMRYISGESKGIIRHQLYAMVSYPFNETITLSMAPAYLPTDGSLALLPMMQQTLSDDLILTLIGQFYLGNKDDIFQSRLGNGILCRLRYYF